MLSQDNQNTEWGNLAPRGLPNEIQYCKNCVISNQKPISSIESKHSISDKKEVTHFTEGVCDACKWAQMKEKKILYDHSAKQEEEKYKGGQSLEKVEMEKFKLWKHQN